MTAEYKEFKRKLCYTGLVILIYFASGLLQITSTTLVEVAHLTDSSVADVAIGTTVYSVSLAIGSLVFGYLLDKMDRRIGLILTLTGKALGVLCVPFIRDVRLFWVSQAVTAFFYMGLDVASHSWILFLWRKNSQADSGIKSKSAPALQSMYLSAMIGISSCNFMVHYFLQNEISSVNDNRILVPYLIVSITALLVSLLSACAFLILPSPESEAGVNCQHVDEVEAREETSGDPEVNSDAEENQTSMREVVLMTGLGCLMLSLHVGADTNSISFLPTYATISDLGMSSADAAGLSSLMSIVTTVTIVVSLFVSAKSPTLYLIYSSFSASLLGNILLSLLTHDSSLMLVSFAALLMALGMSAVTPIMYAFLAERMTVNGKAIGCFMLGKSVARSVVTLITGQLIENTPHVFVIVNVVCDTAALAVITGVAVRKHPHAD